MDRKMHDHTVDLSGVCDRASLHTRLQDSLGLPSWYGRNLDALYDVLTDEPAPLKIFFTSWEELQEAEPEYFDRFCHVLRDVESVLPESTFAFAQRPEDFYAAEKTASPEDDYASGNIFAEQEGTEGDSPAEELFVPEEIFVPEDTGPDGPHSGED